MGNLGRAGYGGTLDGMWPYSYDSCDVGTLPNQTLNGSSLPIPMFRRLMLISSGLPEITSTEGAPAYNYALSYLPGQRLSACTCTSDQTHPGPTLSNGSFVGRGAPEIDMFEAVVSQISHSSVVQVEVACR
jgi:beta-glucanase (GH16 family)